jgi:hypothetical protein
MWVLSYWNLHKLLVYLDKKTTNINCCWITWSMLTEATKQSWKSLSCYRATRDRPNMHEVAAKRNKLCMQTTTDDQWVVKWVCTVAGKWHLLFLRAWIKGTNFCSLPKSKAQLQSLNNRKFSKYWSCVKQEQSRYFSHCHSSIEMHRAKIAILTSTDPIQQTCSCLANKNDRPAQSSRPWIKMDHGSTMVENKLNCYYR